MNRPPEPPPEHPPEPQPHGTAPHGGQPGAGFGPPSPPPYPGPAHGPYSGGIPQQPPYGGYPGLAEPAHPPGYGGYPPQGYVPPPVTAHPGWPPPREAYAGWWARFAARFIDLLIAEVAFVGLVLLLALTTLPSGGVDEAADWHIMLMGLFVLLVTPAVWGWFAYRLSVTGQTPGRQAVGIQVLGAATGKPIGFGRAVTRYLADVLNLFLLFVSYLWPLVDGRKQALHDKLVRTVVVKKPKSR